jgi:peptidoglycan/xylan/chitin deacetylase (PgdA/CDA1 family)
MKLGMTKKAAIVFSLLLVLAAFGAQRVIFGDNLYHGVAVNEAVEQRQDSWWQEAQAKVDKQDSDIHLATRVIQPKIIKRGNPEEKLVALTFDDGPHVGKVEELLDLLRDLDVKATFFVVGKMVEKHPELIKMEADAGHEVEDHSFSHVNLSKVPERDAEIEYRACSDLIYHVLGTRPKFCRPPGGQATPAVMEAAAKNHLVTAMWSDDPKDYSNPGPEVIEDRLMTHVSNGAVILLHEGVDETMQVLPNLVQKLRSEGYKFVTMDQLYAGVKPGTPNRVSYGQTAAYHNSF